MPAKKIVVLGFMGNCPIAGVIWQHIHYIVGLQQLRHDVYYIEDTSRYPYNPVEQTPTDDYSYASNILTKLSEEFNFKSKWAFSPRYKSRDETAGLSRKAINQLYVEADALLNICGSHELNDDLLLSENLIYVESDPAVEQIKVDKDETSTIEFLTRHRARFTFGENIGTKEFPVPLHGIKWFPTRQPVVINLWDTKNKSSKSAACFTSIANLATGGKKDIEWNGEHYLWSKLPEFEKFRLAPQISGEDFELATTFKDKEVEASFKKAGWKISSPDEISVEYHAYVDYIKNSKGEFTVAKDQYVRLNTGWFSDRSACYLAAGRPVITQETGFSRIFGLNASNPAGLFPFNTVEDVKEAVKQINSDYEKHSAAALEIAREYFAAEKVLAQLLDKAGI